MSVRKKLNLGFIALGMIMFISLAFATVQLERNRKVVNTVFDEHLIAIQAATNMNYLLSQHSVYVRASTSDTSKNNEEKLTAATADLFTAFEQLQQFQITSNIIKNASSEISTLNTEAQSIMMNMREKNTGQAITLLNSTYTASTEEVTATMHEIAQNLERTEKEVLNIANRSAEQAEMVDSIYNVSQGVANEAEQLQQGLQNFKLS